MKLPQRLLFYGFGFVIGLLLLFFFLGGKKTSCDYGPDARVLKNIRIKERIVSEKARSQLASLQLDTASISSLLRNGDVNFSESNTKVETCKKYVIEGTYKDQNLKVNIENCEERATIINVERMNN